MTQHRVDLQEFIKMVEGFPRLVWVKDRPRLDGLEEFLGWCKQLPPEEQSRSFIRDYWEVLAEARAQGTSFREARNEASEKAKALAQPGQEHQARLFREYMRSITPYQSLSPRLQHIVRELCVSVEKAREEGPEPSCPDLIALQEYVGALRLTIKLDVDVPFPELPCLEELQFVDACLREWKERASGHPRVQQVLTILRQCVESDTYSLPERTQARKVLEHLYSHLIPPVHKFPLLDPGWGSQVHRCALLLQYEEEHAKIKRIMGRQWNAHAPRVLALKEAYPGIPEDELRRWRSNKCAQIAQDIVANRHEVMTADTLRKVLQLARKERRQQQQTHPPTKATE